VFNESLTRPADHRPRIARSARREGVRRTIRTSGWGDSPRNGRPKTNQRWSSFANPANG